MQNKLQELTDKLYNEGLAKGKAEAEEMVAAAKDEAAVILQEAQEKAAAIILQAEKDADAMKVRAAGDLKMASSQTMTAIRQQAEKALISKAVSAPVGEALSDGVFLKEIIRTIAAAFNASNPDPVPLDLLLPAQMKQKLGDSFAAEVKSILDGGLDVRYVKGLSNGFKIGPKDGGYQISFTADDFTGIIAEYLRPATRKILFGE